MMKLQFWRPTSNNRLGHVALKTDRYYVSFRPTKGSLPGGGSSRIKNGIPVSQIMESMKGCLVLHQSLDRNCESGCDPIEYEIIIEPAAGSSNEHVNSVVEEFLRYNGIDSEDVTIEKCEELYKKRREYKLLPPEEARNVEEPEKPVKLLPKTEYSYDSVELMSGKTETDAEPFYHKRQSCVSLLFNVIQTAWLRRHPNNQPASSPMSNPVELITDLPFQMFYKVPWFEKVVRKHLTSRIVNSSNSTTTEWVDTVLGAMSSNTEMPTVYIWYPDKNNRFGHAALQTDKYHISFWSADAVDGKKRTVTQGIPGSLVFHQKLDMEYEGNRLPTATYQIDTVTNEAINRIHQEFLRYNDIDPADVTMEAAEKLLDEKKTPERSVGKTPYTFVVDIRGQVSLCDVLLAVIHWYTSTRAGGSLLPANLAITGKPPWYHSKQSCLSLCYHMILNADAESQGIARLYHFVTLQALDNFTVPWFESHVKKYWIRNSLLHTFNLGDNSVTRSARYWLWDKWTSSSSSHPTQEIGTFRQFLSRGLNIFRKMKQNKLLSFLCLSGLVAFFHLIEEHYYPIGKSMIFNILTIFLPFFFLYFPAN